MAESEQEPVFDMNCDGYAALNYNPQDKANLGYITSFKFVKSGKELAKDTPATYATSGAKENYVAVCHGNNNWGGKKTNPVKHSFWISGPNKASYREARATNGGSEIEIGFVYPRYDVEAEKPFDHFKPTEETLTTVVTRGVIPYVSDDPVRNQDGTIMEPRRYLVEITLTPNSKKGKEQTVTLAEKEGAPFVLPIGVEDVA